MSEPFAKPGDYVVSYDRSSCLVGVVTHVTKSGRLRVKLLPCEDERGPMDGYMIYTHTLKVTGLEPIENQKGMLVNPGGWSGGKSYGRKFEFVPVERLREPFVYKHDTYN